MNRNELNQTVTSMESDPRYVGFARFLEAMTGLVSETSTTTQVYTPVALESFHQQLNSSIQTRQAASEAWASTNHPNDILTYAKQAWGLGQPNEAIWCVYLAIYFGRPTAVSEVQRDSAGRFYLGLGGRPFWTWRRFEEDQESMQEWLESESDQLSTLRFGRHRKYESSKPKSLFDSLKSFLAYARHFGGPALTLRSEDGSSDAKFETVYQRLKVLRRFGRTARYDFLVLLNDLGMYRQLPESCYLAGATGPLQGAIGLWGERPTSELDSLASSLARRVSVPVTVIEDALANWMNSQHQHGSKQITKTINF